MHLMTMDASTTLFFFSLRSYLEWINMTSLFIRDTFAKLHSWTILI